MRLDKEELSSSFLKSEVISLSPFKAELLSHCSSTAVYDIPLSSSVSLLLSYVKFCYIRPNQGGRSHMWELLQDCWKSIQVKLVERNPRVCKAVIKKNLKSKIYFDLFNTFLVTTWFHICYFIVLRYSLLFYNVENSKK